MRLDLKMDRRQLFRSSQVLISWAADVRLSLHCNIGFKTFLNRYIAFKKHLAALPAEHRRPGCMSSKSGKHGNNYTLRLPVYINSNVIQRYCVHR